MGESSLPSPPRRFNRSELVADPALPPLSLRNSLTTFVSHSLFFIPSGLPRSKIGSSTHLRKLVSLLLPLSLSDFSVGLNPSSSLTLLSFLFSPGRHLSDRDSLHPSTVSSLLQLSFLLPSTFFVLFPFWSRSFSAADETSPCPLSPLILPSSPIPSAASSTEITSRLVPPSERPDSREDSSSQQRS